MAPQTPLRIQEGRAGLATCPIGVSEGLILNRVNEGPAFFTFSHLLLLVHFAYVDTLPEPFPFAFVTAFQIAQAPLTPFCPGNHGTWRNLCIPRFQRTLVGYWANLKIADLPKIVEYPNLQIWFAKNHPIGYVTVSYSKIEYYF